MPDDFPDNTPQKIWQKQSMETETMTLEMIRQKAREYQSKTRRALAGSIAILLVVFAASTIGFVHTSGVGLRMVFVLAVFWALTGQTFLRRGVWEPGLPVDATLRTGIEYYRRELTQQQDVGRRILRWTFGPAILSIGSLVFVLLETARERSLPASTFVPFTTLFIVWVIAFFVLRSREQRKLLREIDQLQDVETASRK